MRRSPSCEWHEWEEMLDDISTVSGLLGIDTSMDGVDLDQFLLATADDFLEPFEDVNSTSSSPLFAATQEFLYEKEQDLKMLRAAGFDVQSSGEVSSLLDDELEPQEKVPMLPTTTMGLTVHCHRKRKTTELYRVRDEVDNVMGKKIKRQEELVSVKNEMKANEQMEKMYRRRYDILHGILEAWNTGGIEDLEEIADTVYDDDVTLISPDYSESLHGVEAVLSHWGLLLDAFPDGMMEDYIIQRDEDSTEQMKATWTFSGTQVFPIFGIEPRHKKVCISGKSLFIFKGDRIQQIVLSWNYGETLLKLMGVQPEEANSVVLSASATTTTSHCKGNQ
ncbi:hypothetical protein DD237_003402 [Peronospora effusa]|uniref:SnoaL-like domain-containing protein n=1 Tax=Peronospora effusa TaxID=542832 RepID=A0A3R7WSA7_9STRA|nr:hypothetical protein DD237_003402 [Peronospora effusa]